jgi:hypothetical protein
MNSKNQDPPKNCSWCGKPLPEDLSRQFKYHAGECKKLGWKRAHQERVYRSKDMPPYKPARLRSPAGMMKMLRDDYMRMKLAGQIHLPKRNWQTFHID